MTPTPMDKQEYRKFGLILALLIGLVFGLALPCIFGHTPSAIPWTITGLLVAWALLFPGTLWIVYKPWMALGHTLGWINTRIILALIFYGVFTPMALVLKILGKDAMNKKLKSNHQDSYWEKSVQQPNHHMEKIY